MGMTLEEALKIPQVYCNCDTSICPINECSNWACVCGNDTFKNGFFTCDEFGTYEEPAQGEWTTGYYICADCNTVIDQATGYSVSIAK
jgi:hypothetical protein